VRFEEDLVSLGLKSLLLFVYWLLNFCVVLARVDLLCLRVPSHLAVGFSLVNIHHFIAVQSRNMENFDGQFEREG
jgi:hypothetical protein